MIRVVPGLLLLVLVAIPAPAPACGVAPLPGERVDIASESAAIIWDEATHTEHFIRRATFETAANDFGFLVPTPSIPSIAEADDYLFTRLAEITAPRVEVHKRVTFFFRLRQGRHGRSRRGRWRHRRAPTARRRPRRGHPGL